MASLTAVFYIFGWRTASPLAAAILPMLGFQGVFKVFDQLAAWWESRGQEYIRATPTELDEAAQTLRDKVREHWDPEFQLHNLDHPGPMPVNWTLSQRLDPRVFASSPAPCQQSAETGGVGDVIARSDTVDEFADRFRQMAYRRMILLGGPGSGKTTFAMLVMRELLEPVSNHDPVPVLVNLAGWNSVRFSAEVSTAEAQSRTLEEEFWEWLERQINDLYPNVHTRLGAKAPLELIKNGRILPVLDGLDEMPPTYVDDAVRSLSGSLGRGQGLILTMRGDDRHLDALRTHAEFLADALVVESQALSKVDAISHLRSFRTTRTPNWEMLCQALEEGSAPSLSEAVSNPLTLWLLYKVYTEVSDSPDELLDAHLFPDKHAVHYHLLDHMIEVALKTDRGGRKVRRAPRLHDPTRVRRYLTFLAQQMESSETPGDFRWWRLGTQSRGFRRLFGGWLKPDRSLEVDFRWYERMFGRKLDRYAPGSANLRVQGRLGALVSAIANRLPYVAALSLALFLTGAAVAMVEESEGWGASMTDLLQYGALSGTLGAYFGVVSSGAFAVGDWATQPLDNTPARTPMRSLKEDIRLTRFRFFFTIAWCSIVTGFLGAILSTIVAAQVEGSTYSILRTLEGLLRGILLSIPIGIFIATTIVMLTPSVRYVAVVTVLALQCKVPWRLMSFLVEVQRLGILRSVGPSYQFAHVALQRRLISSPTGNPD